VASFNTEQNNLKVLNDKSVTDISPKQNNYLIECDNKKTAHEGAASVG
jgi:hypothetical protein